MINLQSLALSLTERERGGGGINCRGRSGASCAFPAKKREKLRVARRDEHRETWREVNFHRCQFHLPAVRARLGFLYSADQSLSLSLSPSLHPNSSTPNFSITADGCHHGKFRAPLLNGARLDRVLDAREKARKRERERD